MPNQVRVIAGPARSGKTAALVERYRQALAKGTIGSALWIAPTNRAVDEVRCRLLDGDLSGSFSPGVFTFARFAEAVLADAEQPIRFVGPLLKRQLLERILSEAHEEGKLNHFGPIAETAGLVDLIGSFISDLKRQEIWSERFAALVEKHRPSDKDRELAMVYNEYQDLLTKHHLYDAEGRFWQARDMLGRGRWGVFAGVKYIVVDGFTDFTFTQHEILQLLADRAEELTITLALENKSERDDLFLKPQQTLQQLQKRHRGLKVKWLPRPERADWPAISHVERQLFRNPRELKPADDVAGVEIIAASGQLAELQSLGRRIKNLLITGDSTNADQKIRPSDIAVVFRSLDGVSNLVQEVFDEYGIPIAIESGKKLQQSPALAALASVLRLQAEDWPFRPLLAVLSNNYFQPPWKEFRGGTAIAATQWAIRRLQIPRGRSELLKSLDRMGKLQADAIQVSPDGDTLELLDSDEQREQQQRFRFAAELLTKLSNSLTKLNQPRTLEEWRNTLQALADETGLRQAMQFELGVHSIRNIDEPAWQSLVDTLTYGVQLEALMDSEPVKLSLAQFIKHLQEILSVEPLPKNSDDTGRVRVLSAQSVRAIEVSYLFIAGLSEKAFPPPARDDRIYSEAECRRWNEAGLQFIDQHQRACEEMLLFYEVVTRPTQRLTLSYPALDESAQPLLPSPYVVELRRCLGDDRLPLTREISLSPVPQHSQPYSQTERRVKSVADWLNGKPDRLAALLPSPVKGKGVGNTNVNSEEGTGNALLAGLQSIAARANPKTFTEYEGLFTTEAAKRKLAKHYGPEHLWSVSRLEKYAYCPFQFMMNSVLGIEELPDLALEINYGRRGSLAHEALTTLHRRLNDPDKFQSPGDLGLEEFNRLRDESIALLIEQVPEGSFLQAALQDIDVRLVAEWFESYFDQHAEYDKLGESAKLRPAHFEVSFGMKPRKSDVKVDPLSTDKPFKLRSGEETIQLSGRVDRIDVGVIGNQVVFNILDYKTGSKKRLKMEDIHAGLALQLPLYAMAVEELLMIDRSAKPWRVGYWYLKAKGFESHELPQFWDRTDAGFAETESWADLRKTLLKRVLEIVHGIRDGQFPVFSNDEHCTSMCSFSTVCRIGHVRSMGKTYQSSHLAPHQ
jgi:ATP-dependent helicase/nuclease subunit B